MTARLLYQLVRYTFQLYGVSLQVRIYSAVFQNLVDFVTAD